MGSMSVAVGDNKDRFDPVVFVIHAEVAGNSWNWQW